MNVTKTVRYNDTGQVVTIQLQCRYEDLEVVEYPESCVKCPVGFQNKNCGRNFPFALEDYERRPATCRLRKVEFDGKNKLLQSSSQQGQPVR